ncbi:hypothetical protein [uncultured Mediterranean phage uvDeep-CGR2-AD8-C175]|nr:hypothetical protein [uncultured Mediterranean phage uvDeep-CGR2-AD8-C175]
MATQKLNIDIVARDRSKQALGKLQGSLGRLKQSVFNLRNAFIGLGAGLVIRNIVNTGKQIENLQVQLKFLFGSAQEGAKAFDEMAKFAAKVPFSLEEIQAGSGVLAVVSDDAKELANLMKITGNVAAVTGLDFKTTAEQIQRSLSAGISAADLFRDKGVKDMLGFSAGAKVSVEETIAAFERVFGEGGRFDGATDELANTLSGTLSMIGDKVFNFKRVLLDAGFFSQLKKQFGDLNKSLEKNSETMDKIAVTIGTVLAVGVEKLVNGFKFLAKHSDEVVTAFKILISFKLAKMFINIGRALIPVVAGMRALASLTGAGLALVAASVAATTATFFALGKAIDDVEKKINSNFEAQKKAYDPTMLLDQLGSHKKVTKELEKQEKVIFNIFESNNKLVEALKKSEELSKKRVQSSFNIFESDRKLVEATKGKASLEEEVLESLREQNNQFTISNEILGVINQGVSGFANSIARAVVLGKELNASFKELAQSLLITIIQKTIERIALMGIEKILAETLFKKEADKENMIRKQNTNLKRQIALQATLNAMSGGFGGFFSGLFGKASGGAVSKGQPVVVGERGAEVFVPNSSGQITQAARGTGGGNVNVNFNIEAIDSSSFNSVLVENRGIITSIINNALNEKGRRELV